MRRLINTEGSLLINFLTNKPFYFLKHDPCNHHLWKVSKMNNSAKTTKTLLKFKTKFLKV